MISSVTLTYNRYQVQNNGFQHPIRLSENEQKEVPTTVTRRGRDQAERQRKSSDMAELVDRLNSRLNPMEKDLRFRLEQGKKPQIVMEQKGTGVLSLFQSDDLDMLEYNLHEMKGIHLSVSA